MNSFFLSSFFHFPFLLVKATKNSAASLPTCLKHRAQIDSCRGRISSWNASCSNGVSSRFLFFLYICLLLLPLFIVFRVAHSIAQGGWWEATHSGKLLGFFSTFFSRLVASILMATADGKEKIKIKNPFHLFSFSSLLFSSFVVVLLLLCCVACFLHAVYISRRLFTSYNADLGK